MKINYKTVGHYYKMMVTLYKNIYDIVPSL